MPTVLQGDSLALGPQRGPWEKVSPTPVGPPSGSPGNGQPSRVTWHHAQSTWAVSSTYRGYRRWQRPSRQPRTPVKGSAACPGSHRQRGRSQDSNPQLPRSCHTGRWGGRGPVPPFKVFRAVHMQGGPGATLQLTHLPTPGTWCPARPPPSQIDQGPQDQGHGSLQGCPAGTWGGIALGHRGSLCSHGPGRLCSPHSPLCSRPHVVHGQLWPRRSVHERRAHPVMEGPPPWANRTTCYPPSHLPAPSLSPSSD